MRKLLLILAIIAFAAPSYAAMTEAQVKDASALLANLRSIRAMKEYTKPGKEARALAVSVNDSRKLPDGSYMVGYGYSEYLTINPDLSAEILAKIEQDIIVHLDKLGVVP